MNPTRVTYQYFSTTRRFGVELEMGCVLTKAEVRAVLRTSTKRSHYATTYGPTSEGASWHVKDDASCGPTGRSGPKGVELASFVASGEEDLSEVAGVAEAVSEAGGEVNNNCGLHVHCDARDLGVDQVGTLLAYWIKLQDVVSCSLPPRRRANDYCRPLPALRLTPWTPDQLWEVLRPRDLGYYENKDRRVNLNCVNYARALATNSQFRKTLELRWPEGTLRAEDVRGWVRFFLGFVESCKDRPMPADLSPCGLSDGLYLLGLGHPPGGFAILDKLRFETKLWFLRRILAHRSQNLPQVVRDARKALRACTSQRSTDIYLG